MRKLGLIALAATAAAAPVAMAQTVPDPDPFYGIPSLRLNIATAVAAQAPAAMEAPRPGTTWREGAPQMQVRSGPRPAPQLPPPPHVETQPGLGTPVGTVRMLVRRDGAGMAPQMHGGTRMGEGRAQRVIIRRAGQAAGGMGMHGGGRGMHRFHRIDRGGMLPPRWFGSQFVIRNWGGYGFPQPFGGARWIRYYDDALLVDRDGRVRDGRYGMNWDRYDNDWRYDDEGVPMYAGDGGYDDDGYDGGYDDEGEDYRDQYPHGGEVYAQGPHGPPPQPCGPCGARSGYSSYGYGYSTGPVVVTETIVTEAPTVETRTYYEYVTQRVRAAPRHRAAPRRAPARPRAGERG
jgi:Ni/Co efflux regulator RcnB